MRVDERNKKCFEKKGIALVAFDNLRLRLPFSDLKSAKKEEKREISFDKAIYEGGLSVDLNDRASLFELKILGLHMEEARAIITSHIDKVLLNDVREFSIVHGKGTGVLQKLVHDMLTSSPYVKDFAFARPEFGGTGKTLVIMK